MVSLVVLNLVLDIKIYLNGVSPRSMPPQARFSYYPLRSSFVGCDLLICVMPLGCCSNSFSCDVEQNALALLHVWNLVALSADTALQQLHKHATYDDPLGKRLLTVLYCLCIDKHCFLWFIFKFIAETAMSVTLMRPQSSQYFNIILAVFFCSSRKFWG